MKNKIFLYITFFVLIALSGCETLDLEQVDNPSALSAKFLDPNYTFNYVQLQLPDFVNSANNFTQDVTRQTAMTGGNTYDNAFAPVNFNTNWSQAFDILNAIKIMEPKAIANKQYYALGASKVIRSYVIATLVDMYGDIPFTESLLGVENLNPNYDSSASIYKQLLMDIESAKVTLDLAGSSAANSDNIQDLYYGGAKDWIVLANTIKLKMLLTARLAGAEIGVSNIGGEISSIISSGKYIDIPSKDFAFKYGNSRFNPNTRHPEYNSNYEIGASTYIGNYFLWSMTQEKRESNAAATRIVDPRTIFYFFRQENDPSTVSDFILPRLTRPVHYSDSKYSSFFNPTILAPYKVSNWVGQTAIPASGFWGRDHGDNSGIPQDNALRTVGGVYPIGGKYSTASEGSVQNSGNDGKKGVGIMPIILSSYVHFMISEAMLKSGVPGNAKLEFLQGINQSIDKTLSFMDSYPVSASYPVPIKADFPIKSSPEGVYLPGTLVVGVDAVTGLPILNTITTENYSTFSKISIKERKVYIDFLSEFYDNSSENKKLELIIKEYYIAAWGNGIEPYNNYRRTGYPSNFQPTLEFSEAAFFSTALYPGNAVNNNPNVPTNTRTKKVFWDKANLILH